jgi:hypothetical protein
MTIFSNMTACTVIYDKKNEEVWVVVSSVRKSEGIRDEMSDASSLMHDAWCIRTTEQ